MSLIGRLVDKLLTKGSITLITPNGREMVKRSANQPRCGLAMSLMAEKSLTPRL